jgi:hypothetical protein
MKNAARNGRCMRKAVYADAKGPVGIRLSLPGHAGQYDPLAESMDAQHFLFYLETLGVPHEEAVHHIQTTPNDRFSIYALAYDTERKTHFITINGERKADKFEVFKS